MAQNYPLMAQKDARIYALFPQFFLLKKRFRKLFRFLNVCPPPPLVNCPTRLSLYCPLGICIDHILQPRSQINVVQQCTTPPLLDWGL